MHRGLFPETLLQRENQELRSRLKVGDDAGDAERAEILEIKAKLDEMVSRGVPETEIVETMELLKERFADYGRWVHGIGRMRWRVCLGYTPAV